MSKPYKRSLYNQLILKLFLFLVLPLLIIVILFYLKVLQVGNDTYLSSIEIVTRQAEQKYEQHVHNVQTIAQRISSNSAIKGFFFTGYMNKNLSYYRDEIVAMVSGGVDYQKVYKPQIYFTDSNIPQGLNMFYHISYIDKVKIVKDFLNSEKTKLWVTPNMVSDVNNSSFTYFKDNYVYLEKVMVGNKLIFLFAIQTRQSEFTDFMGIATDQMKSLPFKPVTTPTNIIMNYSKYEIDEKIPLEQQIDVLKTQNKYIVEQISVPDFPQKITYIWNSYLLYNSAIIIGFAVCLLVISAAFIVISFIRRIFKTIYNCINNVENSAQTEFISLIKVEGQNEISSIEQAFNRMIEKIQYWTKISNEQSAIAKESQLMALQHQINPHFMYNTLEAFAYKMELYGHFEESDAIVCFSNMLRYNISDSKFATVKEEVDQLTNYIKIQKVKYSNVVFDAVVPDEVLRLSIIRFILQPFVENSFSHGYSGKELRIFLSCVDLGNSVLFQIYDNGQGIEKNRLEQITQLLANPEQEMDIGQHDEEIGLRNISRRLKLFYADSQSIKIDSKEHEWTLVSFEIPKQ